MNWKKGTTDQANSSIAVVKLSHHGSAASTPPIVSPKITDCLLGTYRPSYVIMPGGGNSNLPAWQTIVQHKLWNCKGGVTQSVQVRGTVCPNYMIKCVTTNDNKVFVEKGDIAGVAPGYSQKDFRTKYLDLMKTINDFAVTAEIREIIVPSNGQLADRQFVQGIIDSIWNDSKSACFSPRVDKIYSSRQSNMSGVAYVGFHYSQDKDWTPVENSLDFGKKRTNSDNGTGPKSSKKSKISTITVDMSDSDQGNSASSVGSGVSVFYTYVVPSSQGSMALSPTCDLYKLVSYFPNGMLILTNSTISKQSDGSYQGTGFISGKVGNWLIAFGLASVKIGIRGTLDASGALLVDTGYLNSYQQTGITASFTLPGATSPNFNMVGKLTQVANLSNSSIQLDSLDYVLTFAAVSQNPPTQVDLVTTLNSFDCLLGPVSGFLGINTKVVISSNTTITFDPRRAYFVELALVLKLGTLSGSILPSSIKPPDLDLILTRQRQLVTTTSNLSTTIENCYLESLVSIQIVKSDNSVLNASASIVFVNDDYLSISLIATSSDQIGDLVNTLLRTNVYNKTLPSIGGGSRTLTVTGEVIFELSVSSKIIESISVVGNVTLNLLGAELDLTVSVSFPGPTLQGLLSSTARSVTLDQMTPNGLPSCLAGLALSEIAVYVDFQSQYYSIDAEISASIRLTDEIYLNDARVTFNTLSGDVTLQIQAELMIQTSSSMPLLFFGNYDSQSGWKFTVEIDGLNLNDLISIFPPATQTQLNSLLPTVTLNQVQLTIALGQNTAVDLISQATLGTGSSDVIFNFIYHRGNGLETVHLELSSPDTIVNIGSVLSDMKISNAPPLIKNMRLPLSSLDIDYDFNDVHKVLRLSSSNIDNSFTIDMSGYLNTKSSTQYLIQMIFTNISGFPVVGSIPFPVTSIFLTYATDTQVTQTDISNLQSLDATSPTLSFLSQYLQQRTSNVITQLQFFVVTTDPKGIATVYSPLTPQTNNTPNTNPPNSQPPGPASPPTQSATGSMPPTGWITIQKNFGPIFIDRLGLSFDTTRHVMWLLINSTLQLGPLSIALNGLGVGIQVDPFQFDLFFQLESLGIDYSDGDLAIAGTFTKAADPQGLDERYDGGVTITFDPYTITAAGSYGRKHDRVNGDQTTFFIFGRLSAPLGGPPFAYLTGISAGFGYNQTLVVPTIDNVCNFPLVQGSIDPTVLNGSNPLGILASLMDTSQGPYPGEAWITPNFNGEKWIAAGVDVISFELLKTRALLIVEFGDDFQISVAARSVFNLPQNPKLPQFVNVELGLTATIHPSAGYMEFRASLTPGSFVLDPDCHLTGDFAMIKWYGPNPHAGDFLISLGGYHPAFKAPSYYPALKRLGFNWQYSDNIIIEGDAYFALTPIAAMAGGGLNLTFQSGDLKAWFLADTNIIVYWHPFHFDAEVDISIGVSYKLNLGFCSKEITDELSARVEVWGPPVGGRVHVSWWAIGFTVDFGESQTPSPDFSWSNFKKTLPQNPSTSTPQFYKLSVQAGQLPSAAPGGGLQPSDPSTEWVIRGGQFIFRVEFAVPLVEVKYINAPNSPDVTLTNTNPTTPSSLSSPPENLLSLRVMNLKQSIKSVYTIRVYSNNRTTSWPLKIGLPSQPLPAAIWGDPLDPGSDQGLSNSQATVSAYTTAVCSPPQNYTITPDWSLIPVMMLSSVTLNITPNPIPIPGASTPANLYPGTATNGIQQMTTAWGDSNVSGRRAQLITNLQSDGWGPFMTSTPTILQSIASSIYSEVPWVVGSQLTVASTKAVKIVDFKVGIGATKMHTRCEFKLSEGSRNLRYELYMNETQLIEATGISEQASGVKIDRILSCIYNPWARYTMVVSTAEGEELDRQEL